MFTQLKFLIFASVVLLSVYEFFRPAIVLCTIHFSASQMFFNLKLRFQNILNVKTSENLDTIHSLGHMISHSLSLSLAK
jgi:hypothetical protein